VEIPVLYKGQVDYYGAQKADLPTQNLTTGNTALVGDGDGTADYLWSWDGSAWVAETHSSQPILSSSVGAGAYWFIATDIDPVTAGNQVGNATWNGTSFNLAINAQAQPDGDTLENNSVTGAIQIKDGGVTFAKLATAMIDATPTDGNATHLVTSDGVADAIELVNSAKMTKPSGTPAAGEIVVYDASKNGDVSGVSIDAAGPLSTSTTTIPTSSVVNTAIAAAATPIDTDLLTGLNDNSTCPTTLAIENLINALEIDGGSFV